MSVNLALTQIQNIYTKINILVTRCWYYTDSCLHTIKIVTMYINYSCKWLNKFTWQRSRITILIIRCMHLLVDELVVFIWPLLRSRFISLSKDIPAVLSLSSLLGFCKSKGKLDSLLSICLRFTTIFFTSVETYQVKITAIIEQG